MLVLTRKKGEAVRVGDDLKITILDLNNERVGLEFDVPKNVNIIRDELYLDRQDNKQHDDGNRFLAHGIDDNDPAFKPGNTPHLQYGKEILNDGVRWDEMVLEVINKGCSAPLLAEKMNLDLAVIMDISRRDYSALDFKTGAKLCAIHCGFYPEKYGF